MIQKVLVVFLNRLRSLRFVFFKKELVESCPVCNSDRLTPFAVKRWTGVRIKLIQCTNCKLVLQSPRLTQQSLNMFYSHSCRGKTDYNHKQKMFERGRRRGAYIS